MVDKIISIKNVGPFLKYAPKGDVQFRRVTLIYAENGRGKTTLSAILASLKTGDGTRIVERSRLGLPAGLGTGAGPEVEIRLHNNSTATFHEGIWSQVRSDIEVFDSAFVNDNVYAGHFVDIEHRRNLYRFVVGEEGVKLTQQVDGYDEAIKTPTTNIRAIEDAIRPLIKGGLPLEQFVSLKLSTDIEGKIRSKEVELQALKKATELLSKPSLERLQYAQNPDIGVRALLLQSLQDVSARAEGIVQQHLRQLSVDGAEAWVQQGVRHAEATERCPFCDQPMAGTELLKAFSDYFNSEYLKLKADITALDTEIRSLLSEDRLLSVQKAIVSNESLAVYWSEYVAAEYPSAAFDDLHGAWGRVRELLSQHLARKTDSPLEAISPSPELEAALVAYATQAVGMAGYNRTLEAVNDKIAAKRTEIQRQQISSVQNELDLLLNIKRRHDSDVDALCVLLRTHQETKKRLDSEKKAAKRSLDDYVANVFDQYEAGINLYLQQCGASFRIAAPKTSYAGGKPSSTYGLSINGEVIDLGDSKSRGKPCFRTALSEGDKSGLAFAFFLARLDQDNELADKTVVFDDPITSLDCHRKTCTRQQIARIARKARQVVVLSHDPYFLREILDSLRNLDANTLFISHDKHGSHLEEWDIEEATRGEYFNNYRVLSDYVDGTGSHEPRSVAQCVRPVLEGNLRVRFPESFDASEWLGDFLDKVRNAPGGGTLSFLKGQLDELSDITEYSSRYHHSSNSSAGTEPINEGELLSYARRTLAVLGGVVAEPPGP